MTPFRSSCCHQGDTELCLQYVHCCREVAGWSNTKECAFKVKEGKPYIMAPLFFHFLGIHMNKYIIIKAPKWLVHLLVLLSTVLSNLLQRQILINRQFAKF